MITLAQIAAEKPEAEDRFRLAYETVCGIARKVEPDGLRAVATLDAAKREVEALQKLELELISAGRAQKPHSAPEIVSAVETPQINSDAL